MLLLMASPTGSSSAVAFMAGTAGWLCSLVSRASEIALTNGPAKVAAGTALRLISTGRALRIASTGASAAGVCGQLCRWFVDSCL